MLISENGHSNRHEIERRDYWYNCTFPKFELKDEEEKIGRGPLNPKSPALLVAKLSKNLLPSPPPPPLSCPHFRRGGGGEGGGHLISPVVHVEEDGAKRVGVPRSHGLHGLFLEDDLDLLLGDAAAVSP